MNEDIKFDLSITNHAVDRFKLRFTQKEDVGDINKKPRNYWIMKIFECIADMYLDSNSYVEVIENVENSKKRNQKFVENRKNSQDSVKYVHKKTQLIFIFDNDFKCLISVRIDTGKFKKRRTQHPFGVKQKEDVKD